MKINQVFIDVLPASVRAGIGSVPAAVEVNSPAVGEPSVRGYWATLVESDQGQYFFLAKGIAQELSADEHARVLNHPYLHYFSAALKVHSRMERLLDNLAKGR